MTQNPIISHTENLFRIIGVFDGIERKLFNVKFHMSSQGLQFFIQPYVKTPGVLSKVTIPSGAGSHDVNTLEGAYQTSYIAKYSHSQDGFCHFSQHNKLIGNLVVNSSFSLNSSIGHIFTIFIKDIENFNIMKKVKNNAHNVRLDFKDSKPNVYKIIGVWCKSDEIKNNFPSQSKLIGLTIKDRNITIPGFAVGAKINDRSHDFCLGLFYEPIDLHITSDDSSFIFMGGFSPSIKDHTKRSEFLFMQYPAQSISNIPSADYIKGLKI